MYTESRGEAGKGESARHTVNTTKICSHFNLINNLLIHKIELWNYRQDSRVYVCVRVCVTDERERMACILSLLSLLSTASTPLRDSNWIENTLRKNSRKIHRRRLTVFSSGDIWCSRSSSAFRISIKFSTSIDTLSPSVLHMAALVCVSFPCCFTQRERAFSLSGPFSLSLGWSSCLHSLSRLHLNKNNNKWSF